MKRSDNMRLYLYEDGDPVELRYLNENFERIDKRIAELELKGLPIWLIKVCISLIAHRLISIAAKPSPRAE